MAAPPLPPTDITTEPTTDQATEPASAEAGFYDDPQIYDILHGPGTADDVAVVERITARYAPKAAGAWLEPACGTGRYLRVLAQRGRRVCGFDTSPEMVRYARRRLAAVDALPRASLFVADMEDFIGDACPAGSAAVAFNLINSFRHLMTDAAAQRHFDHTARALEPGGIYIVGLSTTLYGIEGPTEDTWSGGRGRCKVSQVVQYEPPVGKEGGSRVERVVSHMTITTPKGDRHVDSRYGLRTYSLAQWTELIDRSPLRIEAVLEGDGDRADPALMGYRLYVLRPRG